MDNRGLYDQVKRAQSSSEEMMRLIQRFEPLIQKFSRQLEPLAQNRDDAKQEFRLALIEIVSRCPIDHFPDQADVPVLSYISKSLAHKYQQLSETQARQQTVDLADEDQVPDEDFTHRTELHVQLKEWLHYLTPQQRKVIAAYYLYDLSDAEIGKRMHISRQAVYRCRNRALAVLKELAGQK